MTGRDTQQSYRGAVGISATLLPVPQRMDTDAECFSKLLLRQVGESAERNDVFHGIDLASDDAFTLASGDRSSEIFSGQLANIFTPVSPRMRVRAFQSWCGSWSRPTQTSISFYMPLT